MSNWEENLAEDLKQDEGFRARPYRCPAGKLTIGYGRNLEDVGISRKEATDFLLNDIDNAKKELSRFDWFLDLSKNRKRAIVNMVFNLGFPTFCKFSKMIKALEVGQYEVAAMEALNSKWAKQVGKRANRIAALIQQG